VSIRKLQLAELATVLDWAAAEGWNPGLQDATTFYAADPAGFLGLFVDDELVVTVSVVRYDDAFAFVGCYICRPDHRGEGLGLRLFVTALNHADVTTTGLDAVLEQESNYARLGFVTAYGNVRFGGEAQVDTPDGSAVRALGPDDVGALLRYEEAAGVFPSPRSAFLQRWLAAPGSFAFVLGADEVPDGYGVIRRCREGHKIGPLFCDNRASAEQLITALVRAVGGGPVFLDVPAPNEPATAMAYDLGLRPTFETARMYRGPTPKIDPQRVFGVTTLELG
jgi:hypothetical protein